jgi:hypothetical protein
MTSGVIRVSPHLDDWHPLSQPQELTRQVLDGGHGYVLEAAAKRRE